MLREEKKLYGSPLRTDAGAKPAGSSLIDDYNVLALERRNQLSRSLALLPRQLEDAERELKRLESAPKPKQDFVDKLLSFIGFSVSTSETEQKLIENQKQTVKILKERQEYLRKVERSNILQSKVNSIPPKQLADKYAEIRNLDVTAFGAQGVITLKKAHAEETQAFAKLVEEIETSKRTLLRKCVIEGVTTIATGGAGHLLKLARFAPQAIRTLNFFAHGTGRIATGTAAGAVASVGLSAAETALDGTPFHSGKGQVLAATIKETLGKDVHDAAISSLAMLGAIRGTKLLQGAVEQRFNRTASTVVLGGIAGSSGATTSTTATLAEDIAVSAYNSKNGDFVQNLREKDISVDGVLKRYGSAVGTGMIGGLIGGRADHLRALSPTGATFAKASAFEAAGSFAVGVGASIAQTGDVRAIDVFDNARSAGIGVLQARWAKNQPRTASSRGTHETKEQSLLPAENTTPKGESPPASKSHKVELPPLPPQRIRELQWDLGIHSYKDQHTRFMGKRHDPESDPPRTSNLKTSKPTNGNGQEDWDEPQSNSLSIEERMKLIHPSHAPALASALARRVSGFVSDPGPGWNLWNDQKTMLLGVSKSLGEHRDNPDLLIVAPTQIGKSRSTLAIASLSENPIIIVPDNTIVDRILDEAKKVGIPRERIGVINENYKEFGRPITVTTNPSFIIQTNEGNLQPKGRGTILIDEAHLALGPGMLNALARFREHVRIGATASPFYTPEWGATKLLPHIAYHRPIVVAVEDGSIPSHTLHLLPIHLGKGGEQVQMAMTRQAGGILDFAPASVSGIEKLNETFVRAYQQIAPKDKARFICSSVDQAQKLTAELQKAGFTEAKALWATMDSRDGVLENFEQSNTGQLSSVGIGLHGAKDRRLRGLYMAFPTTSLVKMAQGVGRAFTPDPSGTKHSNVVQGYYLGMGRPESMQVTYLDVIRADARLAGINPDEAVYRYVAATRSNAKHLKIAETTSARKSKKSMVIFSGTEEALAATDTLNSMRSGTAASMRRYFTPSSMLEAGYVPLRGLVERAQSGPKNGFTFLDAESPLINEKPQLVTQVATAATAEAIRIGQLKSANDPRGVALDADQPLIYHKVFDATGKTIDEPWIPRSVAEQIYRASQPPPQGAIEFGTFNRRLGNISFSDAKRIIAEVSTALGGGLSAHRLPGEVVTRQFLSPELVRRLETQELKRHLVQTVQPTNNRHYSPGTERLRKRQEDLFGLSLSLGSGPIVLPQYTNPPDYIRTVFEQPEIQREIKKPIGITRSEGNIWGLANRDHRKWIEAGGAKNPIEVQQTQKALFYSKRKDFTGRRIHLRGARYLNEQSIAAVSTDEFRNPESALHWPGEFPLIDLLHPKAMQTLDSLRLPTEARRRLADEITQLSEEKTLWTPDGLELSAGQEQCPLPYFWRSENGLPLPSRSLRSLLGHLPDRLKHSETQSIIQPKKLQQLQTIARDQLPNWTFLPYQRAKDTLESYARARVINGANFPDVIRAMQVLGGSTSLSLHPGNPTLMVVGPTKGTVDGFMMSKPFAEDFRSLGQPQAERGSNNPTKTGPRRVFATATITKEMSELLDLRKPAPLSDELRIRHFDETGPSNHVADVPTWATEISADFNRFGARDLMQRLFAIPEDQIPVADRATIALARKNFHAKFETIQEAIAALRIQPPPPPERIEAALHALEREHIFAVARLTQEGSSTPQGYVQRAYRERLRRILNQHS